MRPPAIRPQLTIRWPVLVLVMVVMVALFALVIRDARAEQCMVIDDGIALWCCSTAYQMPCIYAGESAGGLET